MTVLVVIIFCVTYLLIAGRRLRFLPLGRPAGALLGAVAMVAVGALTPAESYAAVDHDTIALLFAMMVLTVYLDRAGFFESAAAILLARTRTPLKLLLALSALAAILSAFLVNDTVCLFLTPVVVAFCRRGKLPFTPYLLALATSSNIGSAATLVGNPQNMIIGGMSHMPFARFLAISGPAALAGLAVNTLLLALYYRRRLPARFDAEIAETPRLDRRSLVLVGGVTFAIVAGFFAGLHLGYTALVGVLVLMIAEHREPNETFARVDWSLLLFFCSLFVVVAGLAKTGLVEDAWKAAAPHMGFAATGDIASFVCLVTVGSNVVSNVPMVLLAGPYTTSLGDPDVGFVLLAFASTIAGNLTLVGSVANIIVAQGARKEHTLGFLEYLRFGAVSTVLVLLAGAPIIVWLAA